MIHRVVRLGLVVAAACSALLASLVQAHEFELGVVMKAFVKIESDQAQVVVRVPLYLFKSAAFPLSNARVDIPNSAAAMQQALSAIQKDIVILEDGQALAASTLRGRLSLPSDKSFDAYEKASRHVAEPIPPDTEIYGDQGYVDAHLVYRIRSPRSVFSIRTTAAPELGDALKLAVHYMPLEDDERALIVSSAAGAVALNPTWYGAAGGFVALGIRHILTGFDHLLFLLCLVIPLRGVRQILVVITGFTLAHSVTLIGSAFNLAPGGAWFSPFVETVIAMSVVYMALENIIGVDVRRRLLMTMLFGLVHGFGFAYGVNEELQLAGKHLVVALFAFNVGVEIGQILVLAVMLPMLALVQKYVLQGRVGTIILGALIAHVGWHWMEERWDTLAKVPWPSLDAANVTALLLWLAALALAGGLIVAVASRLRLEPGGPVQSTIAPMRSGG